LFGCMAVLNPIPIRMLSIYLTTSFAMIISSTFGLHPIKRIILVLQQLI